MFLRNEVNSLRNLLINIGLVVVLITFVSFVFFNKVMPYITNQDEIVTVPDLKGMTNVEAIRFLEARHLQYEFGDSVFNVNAKPLAVMEQYPKANSKVKVHRKIKLILNATTPPLIVFPDLSGYTYSFAKQQLELSGFGIGNVSYRNDIAINAVLESTFRGKRISAGQRLAKGTDVDFSDGNARR
jgi:eukaryotic-like serine/threonine-protein kinase